MKRDTAIERLRANQDAARALGATALFLFGSTARDEARPDSDVDVFVEYDPASHFSLIDLAGIKLALEDRIGCEVHITTRDSLHPMMRKRIETDSIRIF
jgi:predicted nucleotidyltransferase